MRNLLAGLFAATLLFAAPVQAGDQPVVVELFTSQGCSSCPPADALLTEIARRDNVIALALHVDYWDYLGWPDTFASKEFTLRQRAYARARHQRTIYTPQIIVQGMSSVIGHHRVDVDQMIQKHLDLPDAVDLRLARMGNSVEIRLHANGAVVGPSVVQVVRYLPKEVVTIRAGENAGNDFTYSNVVTSWTQVAQWNGRSDLVTSASAKGPEKLVVLVQAAGPGPIIAAEVLP